MCLATTSLGCWTSGMSRALMLAQSRSWTGILDVCPRRMGDAYWMQSPLITLHDWYAPTHSLHHGAASKRLPLTPASRADVNMYFDPAPLVGTQPLSLLYGFLALLLAELTHRAMQAACLPLHSWMVSQMRSSWPPLVPSWQDAHKPAPAQTELHSRMQGMRWLHRACRACAPVDHLLLQAPDVLVRADRPVALVLAEVRKQPVAVAVLAGGLLDAPQHIRPHLEVPDVLVRQPAPGQYVRALVCLRQACTCWEAGDMRRRMCSNSDGPIRPGMTCRFTLGGAGAALLDG